MRHHYIFTVSVDPQTAERRPVAEVLDEAEGRGTWIVSARTRHVAELRDGDEVLFYVTGTNQTHARHIVARARVAGPATPIVNRHSQSWIGLTRPTHYEVPIREIVRFPEPIPLQDLVKELGFIRNKESWGSTLMGRITKIPAGDFEVILARNR